MLRRQPLRTWHRRANSPYAHDDDLRSVRFSLNPGLVAASQRAVWGRTSGWPDDPRGTDSDNALRFRTPGPACSTGVPTWKAGRPGVVPLLQDPIEKLSHNGGGRK